MRLSDTSVASRAGAWTRWYPSREAGLRVRSWTSRTTLSEGLPRRFRDTVNRSGYADRACGAPSFALQRPCIVVRGCGYTTAARRRAAVTGPCSDRPDQRRIRPRHPAKHRVGEAPAFADCTVPRALAPSVVGTVTVEVTPIRQLAVRQLLDQRIRRRDQQHVVEPGMSARRPSPGEMLVEPPRCHAAVEVRVENDRAASR